MKAEIGRRERKNRTAGKCVYEGCCVAAHNRLFSLTLFVIYSRRGSTLLPRELCMDTCRVGCSAERRGGGPTGYITHARIEWDPFFFFCFAFLVAHLLFSDLATEIEKGEGCLLAFYIVISSRSSINYTEKREREMRNV
jgi:hypothetical protein